MTNTNIEWIRKLVCRLSIARKPDSKRLRLTPYEPKDWGHPYLAKIWGDAVYSYWFSDLERRLRTTDRKRFPK